MFADIARHYDAANHVLSLGLDFLWRDHLACKIAAGPHRLVLDMACGTADLSRAVRGAPGFGGTIVGVDFCAPMLHAARRKGIPLLVAADCLRLPLPDGLADAVVLGFGIRNFESVEASLREMRRVLKPGGRVLILEFSQPRRWLAPFYRFYLRFFLPSAAWLITGNRKAYEYLGVTIRKFPGPEMLGSLMKKVGFRNCRYSLLSCGIVAIHDGQRPEAE